MTTIRRAVLAFVVLCTVTHASAASYRQHHLVANRDKTPVFDVTYIYDSDESRITGTFLVADSQGPLLRVDVVSDYTNRQNVSTYALLRGNRKIVRIVQHLPFASTTKTARREELKSRPSIGDAAVPVTIEVSSAAASRAPTIRGLDSDWRTPASASDQHAKVREAVGNDVLAVLTAVREIAGLPMFSELNQSLSYLFDEKSLVRRSKKLMVATTKENCEFDARFGVPCKPSRTGK